MYCRDEEKKKKKQKEEEEKGRAKPLTIFNFLIYLLIHFDGRLYKLMPILFNSLYVIPY